MSMFCSTRALPAGVNAGLFTYKSNITVKGSVSVIEVGSIIAKIMYMLLNFLSEKDP